MKTTNNKSPVKEEKDDHRIIYYKTSNSKCDDEAYFNALCKPILATKQCYYHQIFMGTLFHYMKTQNDVSE